MAVREVGCSTIGTSVEVVTNTTAIAAATARHVHDSASVATPVMADDGRSVMFKLPDLEDNSIIFTVLLDYCGMAEGADVQPEISYTKYGSFVLSQQLSFVVPTCGMLVDNY